jgi:Flp pilus assembly protein TadG
VTSRHSNRRKNRRGAVALELVLVLTFLFIPLLVGIWEIGCVLSVQQTLAEAVREGGRAAAAGDQTNAQVQQVVLSYLQYALSNSNFNTSNVVVTVSVSGGGDSSTAVQLTPITVTATVPFSDVNWSMSGYFVPKTARLAATSTWNSANDITFPAPAPGPTNG